MGLVIAILILVLHAEPVQAKLVINEFLADLPSGKDEAQEEWVELYNQDDQAIDLTGYVLSDDKNNRLVITDQNSANQVATISAKSYLVVYRRGAKFSLNNTQDTVSLFSSTQSADPIDSFSYSKTVQAKTWGRLPDGTGEFVAGLIPSLGIANILPTPDPTTPPTATPTTKPKITPSPTSSTVSTIAPQVLGTITKSEINTKIKTVELNSSEASSSATKIAIGNLVASTSSKPEPSETNSENTTTSIVEKNHPVWFIGSGVVFLASAVLVAKKNHII